MTATLPRSSLAEFETDADGSQPGDRDADLSNEVTKESPFARTDRPIPAAVAGDRNERPIGAAAKANNAAFANVRKLPSPMPDMEEAVASYRASLEAVYDPRFPGPTAEQQARVPHHLLDLRNPDQPITLQEFQAEAEPCIARELEQRGMALLVGGSGLYLKALTSGLKPPAVPPQAQLREQLSHLGQAICHPLLQQADPGAAEKIAPADAVRTQRALEVLYATGRPMSSQATAAPPPWRVPRCW